MEEGATLKRDPGRKKRECSNLRRANDGGAGRSIGRDGSAPTIDELWANLDAADAAVAAFGPTPEQLWEEAAEAERMASENGTPAKSAKVIGVLRRRWSDFLDVHGDAYGFQANECPTIELAVHFQVRLFATCARDATAWFVASRVSFSRVRRTFARRMA